MYNIGMTGPELKKEYCLDQEAIRDNVLQFIKSKWLKKALSKAGIEGVKNFWHMVITENLNAYFRQIKFSKTEWGGWEIDALFYALCESPKGVAVIAFYEEHDTPIRFTTHFFERYLERFLCLYSPDKYSRDTIFADVVQAFFERNPNITWYQTESVYNNKVHFFSPVNDGIALLQYDKDKKLLQANTFILYNDMDEKQQNMLNQVITYYLSSQKGMVIFDKPDFLKD